MCSITRGGERLHNVMRQIGSKLWCPWQQKAPLTYNGENDVSTFSVAFDLILFVLAGNEDMHKICPWVSKKFPRLKMGKCCLHASSLIFDWIIIKVTGKSTHFGVTCPWVTKISLLNFNISEASWPVFYQILCVASLGWGKGCIRFWGRLDQNSGFRGNRKPPLTYKFPIDL